MKLDRLFSSFKLFREQGPRATLDFTGLCANKTLIVHQGIGNNLCIYALDQYQYVFRTGGCDYDSLLQSIVVSTESLFELADSQKWSLLLFIFIPLGEPFLWLSRWEGGGRIHFFGL